MFAKPFKVKANNALKNSERKTLVQRMENLFSLSAEDTKQLIPNKSSASYVKLTTHAGHAIGVFTVDNVPLAFEASDRLYPTVYTLWKIPKLLPTITVHAAILSKLQGGVPLYLPGVTIPVHGVGFPQFRQGDIIAVNTDDNSAAVIVGHAMMGSGDMLLKASGVCLETIHILGDAICKEGKFARVDRPKLGPPTYCHNGNSSEDISSRLTQLSLAKPKEDWPSLGGPKQEWPSLGPKPSHPEVIPQTITTQPETVEESEEEDIEEDVGTPDCLDNEENINIPTDMDALLKFCLLSFMKLEGKRTELPLKTNLLYRNHMVRLCPDDRVLDVKKSTYKKMGKFMDAMEKEGLLLCKEIEKGVDAITGIELAHPDVRTHTVPPHVISRLEREATANAEAAAPCVKEMFSITANVVDLFLPLRKGSMLTSQEVRSMLTDYVKRNNLQDDKNKKMVLPNPTIAKVTGRSAPVSWEELMKGVLGKMTCCTEMRFPDGSSKVTKSKMEPIKIHMEKRSGNKMVTIVSNLEVFGLNLATLSKECQHGLSVACSITRLSSSKTDQLMIQGVQPHFIIELLTEKYGLPKKYIEGVEEHLKKKRRLN